MEIMINGFNLKMKNTEGTCYVATNRNNLRLTVAKHNGSWYADLKIVDKGQWIFSTWNKDLGDLMVRIGYLTMEEEERIHDAETAM